MDNAADYGSLDVPDMSVPADVGGIATAPTDTSGNDWTKFGQQTLTGLLGVFAQNNTLANAQRYGAAPGYVRAANGQLVPIGSAAAGLAGTNGNRLILWIVLAVVAVVILKKEA